MVRNAEKSVIQQIVTEYANDPQFLAKLEESARNLEAPQGNDHKSKAPQGNDQKSNLVNLRARVLDTYMQTMNRVNVSPDLESATVWANVLLHLKSLNADELETCKLAISFARTNLLASRVVLESVMRKYV